MKLLLIACVALSTITNNYYGDKSYKVISVSPDSVCAEGTDYKLAVNRIARANYKHRNYKYAYSLVDTMKVGHRKLRLDTIQLKALILQNIGKQSKADSLYRFLISNNVEYDDLNYRIYLNYAELQRLKMNYDRRERYLLKALAFAEGEEYNKTIRVLARHYFKVLLDFKSAEKILQSHEKFEHLDSESKAGYRLVQAQLAEAKKAYKKAERYYKKANRIAAQAGFVSFQYDAADGAMRSQALQDRQARQNLQWRIFQGIFIAVILLIGFWNWYLKQQHERTE